MPAWTNNTINETSVQKIQAWSPVHPAPESLIVSYDNYRDVTDIVAVIARV